MPRPTGLFKPQSEQRASSRARGSGPSVSDHGSLSVRDNALTTSLITSLRSSMRSSLRRGVPRCVPQHDPSPASRAASLDPESTWNTRDEMRNTRNEMGNTRNEMGNEMRNTRNEMRNGMRNEMRICARVPQSGTHRGTQGRNEGRKDKNIRTPRLP